MLSALCTPHIGLPRRAVSASPAAVMAANARHWWGAGDPSSVWGGLLGGGVSNDGSVAPTDPAGVWADRAGQGGKTGAEILAAQPELIVNGIDPFDTSGWIAGANAPVAFTAVGGEFEIVSDGAPNPQFVYQEVSVEIGESYLLKATGRDNGASWGRIFVGRDAGADYGSGANGGILSFNSATDTSGALFFRPDQTNMYVKLRAEGAGTYNFSGITLKKLPGLTGFAPAFSQRPSWEGAGHLFFDGNAQRMDFDWDSGSISDVWIIRDGGGSQLLEAQDMTGWASFSLGNLSGQNGFTVSSAGVRSLIHSPPERQEVIRSAVQEIYGVGL